MAGIPLAHASGFAITAQGTRALGSAFAGQAALDDASTVWFNAAAMGQVRTSTASIAVNVIDTAFSFDNAASSGAYALPTAFDDDGGGTHPVPQIYLVSTAGERLRLGLGLNLPFGLATEYDAGWRGQFVALKSEARAFNVNPSVAWRVGTRLWVGAGLDWQHFTAELTNFAGPAGEVRLKASDSGWGYNLGVHYGAPDSLRAGIAYRSKISYSLRGDATFSAAAALDGGARAALTVPENLAINFALPIGERWELHADATWTRWSRLEELVVRRTTASPLGASGSVLSVLPFDWRNAHFLAIGGAYRLRPGVALRAGLAHDPRVSGDAERTARLPDQSRLLVAVGATWELDAGTLDVAVGHEFVRDAAVNNTVAGVPGALVGSFDNRADVVSLQYSRRF
jgi:long-chain fatty acid transport protein